MRSIPALEYWGGWLVAHRVSWLCLEVRNKHLIWQMQIRHIQRVKIPLYGTFKNRGWDYWVKIHPNISIQTNVCMQIGTFCLWPICQQTWYHMCVGISTKIKGKDRENNFNQISSLPSQYTISWRTYILTLHNTERGLSVSKMSLLALNQSMTLSSRYSLC